MRFRVQEASSSPAGRHERCWQEDLASEENVCSLRLAQAMLSAEPKSGLGSLNIWTVKQSEFRV